MTDSEADVYAAVLRPRPRVFRWFAVLIAGVTLAWLGWCLVLVVRAQRDAIVGKACAEAGYDYTFGECRAPDIEMHIVPDAPKSAPAPLPGPWSSPMGPGGL